MCPLRVYKFKRPSSETCPSGCSLTLQGSVVPNELGTPVVPFIPFDFGVALLKVSTRKKGTLIINGLLGNLVKDGR